MVLRGKCEFVTKAAHVQASPPCQSALVVFRELMRRSGHQRQLHASGGRRRHVAAVSFAGPAVLGGGGGGEEITRVGSPRRAAWAPRTRRVFASSRSSRSSASTSSLPVRGGARRPRRLAGRLTPAALLLAALRTAYAYFANSTDILLTIDGADEGLWPGFAPARSPPTVCDADACVRLLLQWRSVTKMSSEPLRSPRCCCSPRRWVRVCVCAHVRACVRACHSAHCAAAQ